jgi:Cof subfamily protein (haloacid dehalogenase superfamily)
MMKTLYISDLDGTLLNENAELSDYTTETLNRLIDSGAYFTVATARTAASVLFILEHVKINMPIILMNGVLIYDMQSRRYIKKEVLGRSLVSQVNDVMKRTGQAGLMYTVTDDELLTYYERLDKVLLIDFVDERRRKYNKRFERTRDFNDVDADIIYYCFVDDKEHIFRLYDELGKIDGIGTDVFRSIYDEDVWHLEVFNKNASKYNAVRFLKQKCGFEKLVCFGDSRNDLSLFAGCDECYAVANARPELKETATAVIASNIEDGVARFICETLL